MDFIRKVTPILWQILEKKKNCSINVSELDNELTISILLGRETKYFTDKDKEVVLSEIQHYLQTI